MAEEEEKDDENREEKPAGNKKLFIILAIVFTLLTVTSVGLVVVFMGSDDEQASEEAVEVLKETGLSNHPEILKTFARIGQVMAESDVLPGTRGQIGAPSVANAEDQISQRMQDQDFKMAYLDENNSGHDAAVREMQRLFSFTS